jgi:hypothetical protein
MQASVEHRRSSKSPPRPLPPHEEARSERRAASRAAAVATSRAAYATHVPAHVKEEFGPTYGCVEWFIYEEAVPAPQTSCD